MTASPHIAGSYGRAFSLISALGCFALGLIALYSSGVGLIDPKLHRAAGFALSLVVAVAVSRGRRAASESGDRAPLPNLIIDCALIAVGVWSIWSFHFVQTEMETALYDVTSRDAWPALAGLVVFLELCRRLWGWGLFGVGTFGVLYLLLGQDLPGILAHTGFSLKEGRRRSGTTPTKACSGRSPISFSARFSSSSSSACC
ncbi:MAG: hypothetical protein AAF360_19965 [Pseudomonadota bacterium]